MIMLLCCLFLQQGNLYGQLTRSVEAKEKKLAVYKVKCGYQEHGPVVACCVVIELLKVEYAHRLTTRSQGC